MSALNDRIVIAGAGIAGLSAAIYLKRAGYTNITLVEQSDRAGGRLKTDEVDGFRLNNGLYLVNTQYHYLQEVVDLSKLDLLKLKPGLLVFKRDKINAITAPFARNFFVLRILLSDLGKFKDKIRLIKKRIEIDQITEDEIFEKYELRTSSYLRKKGFSAHLIGHFFKPFFSGLMKEEELSSSRRLFDYLFKIQVSGKNTIPKKGTEAIIEQMVGSLSDATFIYNTSVLKFNEGKAELDSGKSLDCDILVVATEQTGLFKDLKVPTREIPHRSATTVYFTADKKPFKEAMICCNANEPKLVNNLIVLTNLPGMETPGGKELICVSLNGMAKTEDKALEIEIKNELSKCFGSEVERWNMLKVFRTDFALPNQDNVFGRRRIVEMKIDRNVYVCGDHLLYGTIDAAVKSGKMVAEIINRDYNKGHLLEKREKYNNMFK